MQDKLMYALPIINKDKKSNETNIYRHPEFVNKDYAQTIPYRTMHDYYKQRLSNLNRDFIGQRKITNGKLDDFYTFQTTQQIFERAENLGSGLINMGLTQKVNEWQNMELQFVGIYSRNRVETFVMDIGCCIQNIVVVPIYSTLGQEAIQFAFDQTKMTTCFICSSKLESILEGKKNKGQFKTLQNLVIMDYENVDKSLIDKYPNLLRIIPFSEVENQGKNNKLPWAKVTPQSIYAFSYTSGTTGQPKGAMLSHKNMVSTVHTSKSKLTIDDNTVYLSYLPMAHSFERVIINTVFALGGKIGLYQGNNLKLLEDIKILNPTIYSTVPRILNKIYDTIHQNFNKRNFLIRKIAYMGKKTKMKNLHEKLKFKHWFYDFLIFNKIKKLLGNNIQAVIIGSAPISEEVIDFLKIAFQCPIIEGYGQTEGNSFEFSTDKNDPRSGHVGGPFSQVEFKLVDVPEMNYTSQDKDDQGNPRPRGELWVRGPSVFPGYYKLDQKNKETITEDGWLQSGDICQIVYPNNKIQIIDRKKNIFKLSQGEYIAPEKLEAVYKDIHPFIGEIFVYGDSLKSRLVAIVQINRNIIDKVGKDFNCFGTPEELQQSEELKKAILNEMEKMRKKVNFNSLERIQRIHIEIESWEVLNLITTSFKKKRFELKLHYKNIIEKLYEGLD